MKKRCLFLVVLIFIYLLLQIEIKNKREYTIDENYYYQKDLYEAEFYKQQPFEYVREKIKKDGVKIEKLISQRGIIFET